MEMDNYRIGGQGAWALTVFDFSLEGSNRSAASTLDHTPHSMTTLYEVKLFTFIDEQNALVCLIESFWFSILADGQPNDQSMESTCIIVIPVVMIVAPFNATCVSADMSHLLISIFRKMRE